MEFFLEERREVGPFFEPDFEGDFAGIQAWVIFEQFQGFLEAEIAEELHGTLFGDSRELPVQLCFADVQNAAKLGDIERIGGIMCLKDIVEGAHEGIRRRQVGFREWGGGLSAGSGALGKMGIALFPPALELVEVLKGKEEFGC